MLVNTGAGDDDRQGARGARASWPTRAVGAAGAQQLRRRQLPRRLGLVEPVHQHGDQLAGAAARAALHRQHQRRAGAHRRQREDRRHRLLPARRRLRRRRRHRRQRASIIAHENVLNRVSAPAGTGARRCRGAGAWPTDTYFDEFHKLPDYFNGEAVIVYHAPGRQHRRRQHRLLPPLGGDQRRQRVLDGQLSGDRRRRRRQHPGRHRRAEPDPRSGRRRVPCAGRHLDRPGARPAVGHGRRRLLPQHADDDPRPGAGPEGQGPDAGAGDRRRGRRWTSTAATARRPARGRRRCSSRRCIGAFRRTSDAQTDSSSSSRVLAAGTVGVRPPFLRRHLRHRASRSRSKASWCSSSTANPHSFVTAAGARRQRRAAALGGRVERHRPARRTRASPARRCGPATRSSSSAARRACPASTGC